MGEREKVCERKMFEFVSRKVNSITFRLITIDEVSETGPQQFIEETMKKTATDKQERKLTHPLTHTYIYNPT